MKEREDYLFEFENKLITTLGNKFKSINKQFSILYSITLLIILFNWGSITQLTLFGATVGVNGDNLLLLSTLIMLCVYTLLDYNLIRITKITRAINVNSKEIIGLNEKARPILASDLQHFEEGVAGMVISIARWRAKSLLVKIEVKDGIKINILSRTLLTIFKFVNSIIHLGINFLLRPLIAVIVFYVPLAIMGYYIYSKFSFSEMIPLILFYSIISVAIATMIYGFLLFASYFVEIIITLKKEFKEGTNIIIDNIKNNLDEFSVTKNVLDNLVDILKLIM